jgi:hypothetical protein
VDEGLECAPRFEVKKQHALSCGHLYCADCMLQNNHVEQDLAVSGASSLRLGIGSAAPHACAECSQVPTCATPKPVFGIHFGDGFFERQIKAAEEQGKKAREAAYAAQAGSVADVAHVAASPRERAD